MKNRKGKQNMLVPTIIMGILAFTLLIIGYLKGEKQHLSGLHAAWNMLISIIPLLIFAFIIAGMIPLLIPKEFLAKWVGRESGLRGVFIGSIAGGLSPGGPFVSLPIAAGLFNAGASVGTMVAYLTGWSLWGFTRIILEVGFLGWKFTVIRVISSLILPPIAGIIAQTFFSGYK